MKTTNELWLNPLFSGKVGDEILRFERVVENLDGWGSIYDSAKTLRAAFVDCVGTCDLYPIGVSRDEWTEYLVEYCQAIMVSCGYASLVNVVNWSIPEVDM